MKVISSAVAAFALMAAPALPQQKGSAKTASKAAPKTVAAPKQAAAGKSAPKQAVKQVAGKQAASKQAVGKQAASKQGKVSAKYTPARRPVQRYYAQMQPTPDRYKEIQQKLADKGYFAGPVDGTWGPASTDALKRFQHDQNLSEEGKIDALSLTALGLGPRRAAAAAVEQPASTIPPPPPQ